MAGNVLSKLTLALIADSSSYSSGLQKAQKITADSAKGMGTSLSGFRKTAEAEMGASVKSLELVNKQQKLVRENLEKTAVSAKSELAKVNAAIKLSQMDQEKWARAWQKNTVDVEKSTVGAVNKLSTSLGGLKAPLAAALAGLAGLAGAQSIKGTLELASTFNTLNQRVKTATKETGDYAAVQERLYKMAIKNGAQMSDTVQVFQGLARSAKELGASNTQMLTLTDTMQKLGVISGASASGMSAGLLQFSQAMAGGVVHAEEWNSIVENIPEVAQRIAKGLGLSIGETRQLMLDGKLLSKEVFDVLLKQSKQIDSEFSKMPRSMQQAYAGLETAWGKALSRIDSVTGATKLAVGGIDSMTTALERLAKEAGKTFEINGQKTDIGHAANALVKGAGRHISNKVEDTGNLFNMLNPFNKNKPDPMWAEFDSVRRELEKQDLIRNELRLPDEEKPAAKGDNGKASDKQVKESKKHTADVQRADDLLASMRAQNAELEAKLRKDDEAVTKEKALLKLSKDRTLTDKERNKYAEEINKLAARHAELIKQESIQKEQEKLKEILASHKEKIELLKAELSGETENNSILTAQKEIRNAVKVGMKETAAAQQEIVKAAKEEAVLRDAVKLKGIEESLKSQLASTMAKNDNAAELIPILEAEKKIREAITAGMGENVAQQERIRNLARQVSDEILQKQYEAEKKKISEIGKGLDDENEKLKLKLAGQENLAKYLDSERDVRKEIAEATAKSAEHIKAIQDSTLSDSDKKDRIQKVQQHAASLQEEAAQKIAGIQQAASENTKLTQALTDQEKILENIKDSTGSYKQKLAELDAQYSKGAITQKQWSKTAEELWKTQSKTSHTLGDGIKQLGQGMMTAIANGTKLTDVFKNMGKQLLALAAQKLLLEPLANSLDNISQKLFGTGKYTSKPIMPGTANYGQLASNQPMLGNALGGPVGAGGMLSTAGGGALNLLKSLFNSSNNAGSTTSQPISSTDAGYLLSGYGGYNMKGYASGGYYGGDQPFIAGERGPELIMPGGAGRVFNNQDTQSMFGAYGGGFGAAPYQSQHAGAQGKIEGWMQDIQSGRAGGVRGGGNQQMGYWEAQELRQNIRDTYNREMNWGERQLELALYSDQVEKERARLWLANPTTYNGIVNDNERARMELRSVYGTGAEAAVRAGGRSGWGGGNQQLEHILKAERETGVMASQGLKDLAGFDANIWNANEGIFGPVADSSPLALRKIAGNLSYNSMGLGAGRGNTNHDAVYGGDFWDKNSGGNGQERMDAMGGKDFMWQKFHGFRGAGYENISDMWGRFHDQNLSFGGGNYIGDPTYGKRAGGGYGSPSTLRKADQGLIDYYGPTDETNWRPGKTRAMVDQAKYGKYTLAGGIAVPNYGDYSNAPPISGYDKHLADGYIPEYSGDYTRRGLSGLSGRSGETDNKNLNGPRKTWSQGADVPPTQAEQLADIADQEWMAEYGSSMDLGYSKKGKKSLGRYINSGTGDGLRRNTTDFWKNQSSFARNIPGLAALAGSADIAAMIGTQGLQKIVSYALDTVSGGAVGSGKLSTSGDVFDNYGTAYSGSGRMSNSQRLNSQYSNFADGFDGGYFGAQTGAYSGATRPSTGWQIQGVRQGARAIKGYAQGGMVSGGELALVGERGPELIVPKAAGRVIPNDKIQSSMGELPKFQLINQTSVEMGEPRVVRQSDGSLGIFLRAVSDNAARNGSVARGVAQAGRRPAR